MNLWNSNTQAHHLKWLVLSLTSLMILVLVIYFYIYRSVTLVDSILGAIVSVAIASGVIWFLFSKLENLQSKLDQKIDILEKQSQREAMLAHLSKGFAALHHQTEICDELIERLQLVHGYDFVAVFIVDHSSGNRALCTEALKEKLPSTPVLRPGEGLSERPLFDGKLHYTPDITLEAAHVPGLSCGSEIDVPIKFNGEVLGVIVVESHEIDAFNSFDFEMLTIVARQAGLALKNAQLLALEKGRRRQAEVLFRATSTLTSALELDQVLAEILEQLQQVIDHDSACIFIQENNSIHAMAAHGLPEINNVIDKHFPADNPLFQLVFQKEQPIILEKINKDPRFEGWGGTSEMRSWMGVPLIFLDRVIGCLTLDSKFDNAYGAKQGELAQIFANQAAIAIENARLYRSTKDSADRQKLLHQLSQEMIQAGMDLEQIYQSVHATTEKLMPADSFVISILDEKTDEIVVPYLCDKGIRANPRSLPSGEGLSGYIIKTGKPFLAFDFYQQEELQSVDVVHFGSEEHIRSIIAVPMRLGERTIGMLSAQTYKSYDYSVEDQQLLDMLAAYSAIAINNARLFEEVQRLAITDSLTGTYNRRYFYSAAQKEIKRARRYKHPIAVMMLDLDNYKEINDTYGHDVGDQALRLIAQRCKENIRDADILARYGGDEFILLLPETDFKQALETAERLRSVMQKNPIELETTNVKTTTSIGITGATNMPPDLDILLKNADLALYDAKHSGKNCVKIFNSDIRQKPANKETNN